ncbi:MAG TPA: preprotein translocase subunit YajC [Gaiellaceae bacterium]|nr:preprotein translocase subunit YajC [Gaiellaceae bacterium]
MIGASSGGSSFFLIIIVAFLLLWLIVVRPQRKRQTQQQQMLSDLRVGDEVLTAGGIYGTVARIDDDRITVEIAPRTEVQVARRAIAGVTREPEPGEEPEAGESQPDEDGDRWRSAFDDDDAPDSEERDASKEKKRG